MPWFGPNVWQAIVRPVPGGNIPSEHALIEIKFTFKEGGATDFHSHFERIKERFQQAFEAQATVDPSSRSGAAFGGIDMDSVHLEQLPTYEAAGQDRTGDPSQMPGQISDSSHDTPAPEAARTNVAVEPERNAVPPPDDAPPGYEEAQQLGSRE